MLRLVVCEVNIAVHAIYHWGSLFMYGTFVHKLNANDVGLQNVYVAQTLISNAASI